MDLKASIKKYKKFKGWSNKDLYIQSGVSDRTIEGILRRVDCRISTAKKIADALGITLDQLVGEED